MKIHCILLVVINTNCLFATELRAPSLTRHNGNGFITDFKLFKVTEPEPGSAERKAIMEAMRPTIAAHVGKPVIFTGNICKSGNWVTFQGDVKTADGKAPKNEDAVNDLELDFFALLEKDAKGVWRLRHWGFAGDIGIMEDAREKFPGAPRELF